MKIDNIEQEPLPSFGKVFLVTGINGSGKTTILNRLVASNPEFHRLSASGRLMTKLGIAKGDYETLRRLDDDAKNSAFDKVMREILSQKDRSSTGVLAVDTHVVHCREGKCIPCPIDWMACGVDGIIIIQASSQILFDRIRQDPRRRDSLPYGVSDAEELRFFLEESSAAVLSRSQEIADRLNIPLWVVDNSGSPEVSYANFDQILFNREV